jgi:hypothetical protein
MADPTLAEMEAEAEMFIPRDNFRGTRADKLTQEPPETSPLLGRSSLSDQPVKKWYNTPSVYSLDKFWLSFSDFLVITSIHVDGVEFWINYGSQD